MIKTQNHLLSKVKAIIFDLDDTLIDTSGVLVPSALKEVYQTLKEGGLLISLEEFLKIRIELLNKHIPSEKIYSEICAQFSIDQKWARRAQQVFFNPKIPQTNILLPHTLETLEFIKLPLFLVTSGLPPAQIDKVKSAGLEKYFSRIYYINIFNALDSKQKAFLDIQEELNIKPKHILNVGNKLSHEIREAKQLGQMTCWLKHGEHSNEQMAIAEDAPDFIISNIKELITL